jgi:hypothetical protein
VGLTGAIDGTLAREARALLLEQGALAPVLERFGWAIDRSAIIPFARWLPLGMAHSRIFDTRFYLADLGTGAVDVEVDATENTRLFWVSAKGALGMAAREEIAVIFPTRRNLERLALFGDFAAAKAHAEATPVRIITPQVDESGAVAGAADPARRRLSGDHRSARKRHARRLSPAVDCPRTALLNGRARAESKSEMDRVFWRRFGIGPNPAPSPGNAVATG